MPLLLMLLDESLSLGRADVGSEREDPRKDEHCQSEELRRRRWVVEGDRGTPDRLGSCYTKERSWRWTLPGI